MPEESFVDRLERCGRASGDIIAERVFEAPSRSVRVRIRKPRRGLKVKDYGCVFEIVGLDETLCFKVWGIDSLQALQLALRAAGEVLREKGPGLTWCGDSDIGFPKEVPSFLPEEARVRIERAITREVSKLARPMLKRGKTGPVK